MISRRDFFKFVSALAVTAAVPKTLVADTSTEEAAMELYHSQTPFRFPTFEEIYKDLLEQYTNTYSSLYGVKINIHMPAYQLCDVMAYRGASLQDQLYRLYESFETEDRLKARYERQQRLRALCDYNESSELPKRFFGLPIR